jgi:uncharacterized membrane protein YfcA
MVPLLTGQLNLSQHRAHATSLAVICFIAGPGVIGYWRAGWANRLDGEVLKRICGVVAMGLGLQMLCSVLRQPRESAALQAG